MDHQRIDADILLFGPLLQGGVGCRAYVDLLGSGEGEIGHLFRRLEGNRVAIHIAEGEQDDSRQIAFNVGLVDDRVF